MSPAASENRRLPRVLIIDDNAAIHDDFRKILDPPVPEVEQSVADLEEKLFGDSAPSKPIPKVRFDLESAYQGAESVELVCAALAEGRPFSMAFVDVRMPPGIDGIETIQRIWKVDASLQVVLCTAYSDYSWEEMIGRLGTSDSFVILKKPFDPTEVLQLAHALTEKWRLTRAARQHLEQLETLVDARTAELRTEIAVRQKAEEEARQAMFLAEQASRAKSAFLANMSHEIRTPMNGVLGMCQLLLDSNLSAEQRDLAETLAASSEALLSLLNDVLDISKIEADRLVLEETTFSLEELVDATVQIFAGKAAEKGLDLVAEVDPKASGLFLGDSARLRQILLNLISNGVKFTSDGEVSLVVQHRGSEDGRDQLDFVIRDTGIGVAPQDLPHLFTAFIQADSSITRRFGGTGLGLTICKRLIELMGGSIDVQSTPGSGSTFTVHLAFRRSHEASLPAGNLPTVPTFQGRRVLVVDDCATNRKLVRHLIEGWSGIISEASQPGAVARLLQSATEAGKPFDLLLLDFHMPGTDGITLARELRQSGGIQVPPIILLTSQADRPAQELLESAGISACLFKPLRKQQFAECIASVLTPPAAAVQSHPAPLPTPAPSDNPPHARVLVAEDNAVNQKVALLYLQRMGFAVDLARNGLEAVQAAAARPYHLIFMDCQMPELDGLAATRRIRASESVERHVPIIAMTAGTVLGVREECLQAGMDDYISKPVRRAELLQVIHRWYPQTMMSSPGPALPESSR